MTIFSPALSPLYTTTPPATDMFGVWVRYICFSVKYTLYPMSVAFFQSMYFCCSLASLTMGPVMDTDLVHLGTLLCIWYCEVMDPVIGVSTAGAPCFPTFLVVTLLPEAAVTRLLLDPIATYVTTFGLGPFYSRGNKQTKLGLREAAETSQCWTAPGQVCQLLYFAAENL